MDKLRCVLGIAVFLGIAWLLSSNKRLLSPRIIVGGLLLQFGLGLFILKTPIGKKVFDGIDYVFQSLLGCVDAGTQFVFGDAYAEHFFAFKVLPTIIFFSALMSILYYYGIVQKVVGVFAWVMQRTLGTSGAETLSAAANVFVGQTEAPLVVKPYISSMTMSELNAVMIGGFATMAGGVLGGLVDMGVSARDLLTASVMAAPAALLVAKVMLPETGTPRTMGTVSVDVKDESVNVLEAIANGALGGLTLALNVAAMLIVFISLIKLVDLGLGWVGVQAGYAGEGGVPIWSLGAALGKLFAPLAWLMGIPWNEAPPAGELLGLKMATNEFVAYGRYIEWADAESVVQLSERTRAILVYALCGFANFSSIGIQLGGIGGLAPDRRGDLARLGLRAMIGGTLASFINACIAGILL